MTKEDMFKIYMEARSMREAAKILRIDQNKMRIIRDTCGWPLKNTSIARINGLARRGLDKPRTEGRSIYDAVESI